MRLEVGKATASVRCASAEEVMTAEAVAKTPGVGSESRDYFDVRGEKHSSKKEELEKRDCNAGP